jgi:tetratricopeptide (TPR) repeat protein
MTLAMTPQHEYTGGGTFFEHLDEVLPMVIGQGTFRPGSIRHGGHRVTNGTRYILGAFLLVQDRVEHVRRLKNRGGELRRKGDMVGAARHFEWALAVNPRCVSCLKDSAEIILARKDYVGAEKKIREALALLENIDSDALFTLGLLLSEQGRDDESIAAYQKSVALNAEDVELCYNLGIKLGAKGKIKEEMEMYAHATQVDSKYGGAWLNWGTALAEAGNMDDVSIGNKYAIFLLYQYFVLLFK